MKKHRKQKPRIPPLSPLDKFIYIAVIALIAVVCFGFAYLYDEIIERSVVRSDPSVIAFSLHTTQLFIVPFGLCAFGGPLIYMVCKFEFRQPIFGNRKISYGKEPWDNSCYPLFGYKREKQFIRSPDKKARRNGFAVWCAGLCITLLFLPLGLFGRTCLLEDNSIVIYDVFDQVVGEYTEDNFRNLTLETTHADSSRYGSHSWGYKLIIELDDGRKASIFNNSFITYSNEEKLEKAAEIKACFADENITIKDEEDVDKVADHMGLTEKETEMLYVLFSAS